MLSRIFLILCFSIFFVNNVHAVVVHPPGSISVTTPSESGDYTVAWTSSGFGIAWYTLEESTNGNDWVVLISNNPLVLDYEAEDQVSGSYQYRVKACERELGSEFVCSTYVVSETVVVAASAIDPVADAGPNQTVDENTTVTLSGSGTDSDGTVASFEWNQTLGQSVVLSDRFSTQPTFAAPNVSGFESLTFELLVTDNEGNIDSDTVVITVNNVNVLPIANAGPDQTKNASDIVTLVGSGVDSDGTISSYSWVQTGGSAVVLSDVNAASPTFTAPVLSTEQDLTFVLTVQDNSRATDTDTVVITILRNLDPIADAGSDQFVNEDTLVSLSGSGTDGDGTVVSYEWIQTQGSVVTLSSTTAANPTFTAPSVPNTKTVTFELTVTDNDNNSDTDTVVISVLNVNQLPVADAGPDQSVAEEELVTLVGSGTDPDLYNTLSYSWVQTSGTAVTLSSSSSTSPTFTAPALTADETLVFTLTVTDNDGGSDSDSVSILIDKTNIIPTAFAGLDQSVNEETLVSLSGSGTDEDGTIVSYEWVQTQGTVVTLSSTTSANPTFTAPSVPNTKAVTFELTVTDNDNNSDTDSVVISILNVNQSPVADAGPDQTVEEGMVVTLAGSGTDPDTSDTLSYSWIQTSGSSVEISNANQSNPTFTMPDLSSNETFTFELTVSDFEGASSKDSVSVLGTFVNSAPTITLIKTGATIQENQNTGEITFTISDLETSVDSLTLTKSAGLSRLLSDEDIILSGTGENRTMVITPPENSFGNAIITLTVSDGDLSASVDFDLTVVEVNDPPTISNIEEQVIIQNETSGAIPISISDSESEPGLLTLSSSSDNVAVVSSSGVVFSGSGSERTLTVSPEVDAVGEANVTITVSDEGGETASTTFLVIVTEANTPPTITVIEDQTIAKNTSTGEIPFIVADNESEDDLLEVSAVSANQNVVQNSGIQILGTGNNSRIKVTAETDITGSSDITVTVSDGLNSTHTTFKLTVVEDLEYADQTPTDVEDAFLIEPTVPENQAIGSLLGEGGVSGGAANYSIPIALPPGRAGMQPSVSVNYSSRGGNGLAGVGWGVSAGSAISRCAATLAQDGYVRSPMYDAVQDRLCLDGQKLLVTTGVYGKQDAVYRTEMDSFARVTQLDGDINSTLVTFKVEHKDGSIAYYGTDEINSNTKIIPTGVSTTLTWLIERKHDAVNRDTSPQNTIHYEYLNFGDGEVLLNAIFYTGSQGLKGDRSVAFEYETRDDSSTRWMAGGKQRSTQRLKKISTFYGINRIRDYSFNYQYSRATDRLLLESVQECVAETCLPATTFSWKDAPVEYQLERLDLGVNAYDGIASIDGIMPNNDTNRDGVADWPGYYTNAEGDVTGSPTQVLKCHLSYGALVNRCVNGDFNQDGIVDDWKVENDILYIAYTNDDAAGTSGEWINTNILLEDSDADNDFSYVKDIFDFNADGWPDLVVKHQESQAKWTLKIYIHQGNTTTPYLSKGKTIYNYVRQSSAGQYYSKSTPQFVGDVDGNGLADLVKSRVYGHSSGAAFPTPYGIELVEHVTGSFSLDSESLCFNSSCQYEENFSTFIDVNGDGLPDWLSVTNDVLEDNYFLLRINEGGLNFSDPIELTQAGAVPRTYFVTNGESHAAVTYSASFRVMDINGDGRSELLVPGKSLHDSCVTTGIPAGHQTINICGEELYGTYATNNEFDGEISMHAGSALDNSIYEYDVIYFDESAEGVFSARKEQPCLDDNNKQCLIGSATETANVDGFGDGLRDFIFTYGVKPGSSGWFDADTSATGRMAQYNKEFGGYINRNKGSAANGERYAPSDMLVSVTNGMQAVNKWSYQPLSTGKQINGLDFYQTDAYVEDNDVEDARHFHFASSMYVVSEFEQSNGLGDATNSTSYAYRGAVYNAEGRGFQGFRSIIVDNPNGLRSVSNFHQKFPLAGKIEDVRTCLTLDADETCTQQTIKESIVSGYHEKNTADSNIFWIVPHVTTESTYDLSTSVLLSQKTTTIENANLDDFGNVKSSVVEIFNGFSTVETTTVNSYTNNESSWWFKLDHSTVTTETITGSALHDATLDPKKEIKTTYTYYDSNRKPNLITVDSILDNAITSVVDTDYNTYGLPSKISTTADGQTRSVSTTYSNDGSGDGDLGSDDGYFVYQVTNDLSHTITTEVYPEHGQVKKLIDANGLTSTTSYDAFGRVEQVTPPAGTGQPAYSRFADCSGGCGEVASLEPGDLADSLAYTLTTYAAGVPETTLYKDKFNRVLLTKTIGFDGSDIYQRTEYDHLGRKSFESVPSFVLDEDKGTHYVSYDEQGRLLEKKMDEPARLSVDQHFTTTYTYNNHTTNIVATGSSLKTISMSRVHTGTGQLLKTTDALSGVTEYAYDALGNPIVLSDANSNAITAKHNALGQKEYVIDPNMGRKDFSYNGFGELDWEADANLQTTYYGYDILGRQISRTVGTTLEASFVYDIAAKGSTTEQCKGAPYSESRNDSGSDDYSKEYVYDEFCRPLTTTTSIQGINYSQTSQYDSSYGRVKAIETVSGLTLETVYNEYGYPTQSRNAASGYVYQENFQMDARLQLTVAEKANGALNEKLVYAHETGQMESILTDTKIGGNQRHRIDYEYDDFGNLALQIVESMNASSQVIRSTESYVYDDLHRLKTSIQSIDTEAVVNKIDTSIGYTYDAVGNIKSKDDFGNGFIYGDINKTTNNAGPNAVVSVNKNTGGTASYSYDNNGNMLSGDGKTLTYNAFNKPLTIEKGGITSSFSYGADQMRYKQVKSGASFDTETTIYIDKAYEEITQNGVVKKRSYLGDAIITETVGGNDAGFKIGFVHRDRLNSTVTITNENGDVVDNKSFDPFGKPREGTFERVDSDSIEVPATLDFIRQLNSYEEHTSRGFTDHEHLDDAELIHMNGRVYDYNLGRFLSVDPVIQEPGNSQSMNPYSYIMNNPLVGTDPSGYSGQCAGVLDIGCFDRMEQFNFNNQIGAWGETSNGFENAAAARESVANLEGVSAENIEIESIEISHDPTTGEISGSIVYHVTGGTSEDITVSGSLKADHKYKKIYEQMGDPENSVISTKEEDEAAVAALRGVPENTTSNSENVNFLITDEFGYFWEEPFVNVPIVNDGKTGKVTVSAPNDPWYFATAVLHDHFQGTSPGPGAGDALAVYKGLVNYVKDLNGNIYKIEFHKGWKSESNKQNGWKLTKLYGKKLKGQKRWKPGYTFKKYK